VKDKEIVSKGPKKRDPACFQTKHDITIPAGTILRQEPGKEGTFTCPLAYGKFVLDRSDGEAWTDTYRKVTAA
jgi:hypothetical protein